MNIFTSATLSLNQQSSQINQSLCHKTETTILSTEEQKSMSLKKNPPTVLSERV